MKATRILSNIFIALFVLFIGMLIGASLIHVQPKEEKCNNGISYQYENGVAYKTYIPELDDCK